MYLETLAIPSLPERELLSDSDLNLFTLDGPEAISHQYGRNLPEIVHSDHGISKSALLQYISTPLPDEITNQCRTTLSIVERRLTPACMKRVYAASCFKLTTEERTTNLTTFGVNGWTPTLVNNDKFNLSEALTRASDEAVRNNQSLDQQQLTDLSNYLITHSVSCTAIHQALISGEIIPKTATHFCRMNRHLSNKKLRLPNDYCPSSDYCGEGTAASLKPYAIFLANLLRVSDLTVIQAEQHEDLLDIHFLPCSSTDCQNDIKAWTITFPNKVTKNMLLNQSFPTIDQDLGPITNTTELQATFSGNKLDISVQSLQDPNVRNIELPLSPARDQIGLVHNEVWLSTFAPCALCSLDIPARWDIPIPYRDESPRAVLFQGFSRTLESLDAGDVMPIAYLLNRGIPVIRFGNGIPI